MPQPTNTPSGETVDEILTKLVPNIKWGTEKIATTDSYVSKGHYKDIRDSDITQAKHSLRQAIEGMVERIIGSDIEPSYDAAFNQVTISQCDAANNQLRAEQRQRAKEELSKLFGKEK